MLNDNKNSSHNSEIQGGCIYRHIIEQTAFYTYWLIVWRSQVQHIRVLKVQGHETILGPILD